MTGESNGTVTSVVCTVFDRKLSVISLKYRFLSVFDESIRYNLKFSDSRGRHQLRGDLMFTGIPGFMRQYRFHVKLRTAAQVKSKSLKQDAASLVARLDGRARRRRLQDETLIRRGRGGT